MKATAVGKEVKSYDLPGGECCECGKKLIAPWGRNGLGGRDWVCSSVCQKTYNAVHHPSRNVG